MTEAHHGNNDDEEGVAIKRANLAINDIYNMDKANEAKMTAVYRRIGVDKKSILTFLLTLVKRWGTFDKYRTEKFLLFLRLLTRSMFLDVMQSRISPVDVAQIITAVSPLRCEGSDDWEKLVLLLKPSQPPLGVFLQLCDCFVDELPASSNEILATFLSPFVKVLVWKDAPESCIRHIFESVIDKLLKREELLRLWASVLFQICLIKACRPLVRLSAMDRIKQIDDAVGLPAINYNDFLQPSNSQPYISASFATNYDPLDLNHHIFPSSSSAAAAAAE